MGVFNVCSRLEKWWEPSVCVVVDVGSDWNLLCL